MRVAFGFVTQTTRFFDTCDPEIFAANLSIAIASRR